MNQHKIKPSGHKLNIGMKIVILIIILHIFVGIPIYLTTLYLTNHFVDFISKKHFFSLGVALLSLSSAFFILVTSLVYFFSQRRIMLPLLKLREMAIKISEGDFKQKIEIVSQDELGELAKAFNIMSDRLQKRDREILEANQQLASNYQKLKTAYEHLKELDQLKELNRLKSEFISIAAHELRTPLTALKAHVEIFIKGQHGSLGERQKRALEIIDRSVNRLTNFVNDLVDLTRLEKGELKLEKKPVELDKILAEVTQEALPVLKESNLNLSVNIPKNLPMIIGDSQRLYQVFGNLVNNAIKFTPDGGKISILARQRDEMIEVSVSDNGLGISPDELPKLFTPFYQIKEAPIRGFKGVGLGLVIAKKIVEDHKGKIEVSSAPGKGSTFTCMFPIIK